MSTSPIPALSWAWRSSAVRSAGVTPAVGWILILAGALGIVLSLIATSSRSHTTVVQERRDV